LPTKANLNGFTPLELRCLRGLKTPAGVQAFIDSLPYHLADTAWSPRRSLRERTAHCLEGALLAAAALRVNGYPPLVLDLEAVRDVDHVIAVFRERGLWGAGLRFRAPIYRSLRELALSYFESYYNLRGERTLRGFSRPLNLSRFDHLDWMTSEKSVWAVAEHLVTVSHFPLFPARVAKNLPRLDRRSFDAGLTLRDGTDSAFPHREPAQRATDGSPSKPVGVKLCSHSPRSGRKNHRQTYRSSNSTSCFRNKPRNSS
jgi:hypothetical protein